MRGLRVRLIGLAYLIMWRITRWMPERWAVGMFRWGFDRSWRKNETQRAIVTENLRPIVGDGPGLAPAVRAAFHSYGRYWAEAFRLQDMSDAELESRIDFVGQEILDEVMAAGGAVLGVPHLGNWDAAGRYVAKRWKLAAVVEVLRPKALFERFVAYRRALGMTIIPLHRGEEVTRRCVEHIKATGDLLALVCDRDLSKRGIPVRMFGRTTSMPAGPAVVALRAGVPLIPGATWQAPDGRWRFRAFPPIATGTEPETPEEIRRIMQKLATVFEDILREEPEQWHAFVPY
ncbi:MAG TPA: phosphatidylinositol mannoside acyltransferase, partial [Actinomycetota bacterium]|nr:phosphatidylinositol mannoside acyltransferase [Actinomycetota bacterium]